ncbi:dermonecrotic toxin domain-containing protein [Pseudomonas fluorescens]|uniref:dermonecrotic toxin domain-containing protein n=1 Tax=Pseudomonas fluorescens TaxID=294 RepID=UPI0009D6C26C|nr:DUF6543 domain-containing protein [Pseudomonas fluorescens]
MPDVLQPASHSPDPLDAEVAAEAALQAIRKQLGGRINTYTQPSRLINQVCLVDVRSSESAQALSRLIARSPRVLKVIRAQLRKAFEIDPNNLLFTQPKLAGEPEKVDSLTDRALQLLVLPSVPINVNLFTTLSVKGDPDRRLPFTPLQALRRVIELRLFERLASAQSGYWDGLAQGSWLTRRERWVELYKRLFADQAYMARQLDELSSAGIAMVQAAIDAPTVEARQRAGGGWASVRVGQLLWPGTPATAIPAALHFYREGDPSAVPHVVYLPGEGRNFYEYPSFFAIQCGLLELNRSRFNELWQCLPLRRRDTLYRPGDLSPASCITRGLEVMGDALALGAQALLDGQWENELACTVMINYEHVFSKARPRPQRLDAVQLLAQVEGVRKQLVGSARLGPLREELLEWDQRRRSTEIIFASTAPDLAQRTGEQQIKRYEKGLLALLDSQDLSADTPQYLELLSLISQQQGYAQTLDGLIQTEQQRLLDVDFWAERPGGNGTLRRGSLFINAQTAALRCEAQLQHRLKLLSTAHRDLIIEVVDQPLPTKRPGSETQVLTIAVGSEPDAFYTLHNIWVVTTAPAVRVPARRHPVVLYAFGAEGGVLGFSSLEALTQSLKASLGGWDDSVLWHGVERDKRRDLRTHAVRQTLAVRYVPVKGKPALASIKKVLGTCDRLYRSTEDITRVFSEVKDPTLGRALLLVELKEQLRVPVNSALRQAQANIELVRKTAAEAKNLPAYLAQSTRVKRRRFKHLQGLYLSSAFAFKSRLEQWQPDLETFARRALTERLSKDGISPLFDIDQPLIDMPDDVQGSYCGWTSGCTVGDRKIIMTPTATRTTFSLLQLALHNLDPLAPWTQWRLNRGRFLQPQWRQQLNDAYLIELVSSLDIGGEYDALINRTFYPRTNPTHRLSQGRIPALLKRTLQTGVDLHLFSAVQQGLTANAQSLFKTAMAARTQQDLLKNQHEVRLHVVHLVGHTMQHDRYIAGIVVVQDKRTELCVVYWPRAPQALILTEYSCLQQAQAELNRIGAVPANARALAHQVAPGWAFEAISHHPAEVEVDISAMAFDLLGGVPVYSAGRWIWRGVEFVRSFSVRHLEPTALLDQIEQQTHEQIASDPQNWLTLVATSHSDAQALLYQAGVLELQRQTQAASHSGKALEAYRRQRLDGQSDTRNRALVAFFSPLFGMFNDFYELLIVARRYHRFGDPLDAVDVGFMSGFLAIDLLLNFVPGPKKLGGTVARVARPVRATLGRVHRLRMRVGAVSRSTPSAVARVKALEPYKIKGIPDGAVALKGPGEEGIYVKNGESFVADETHHYPVYRRADESVFRLKNTETPGQDELILHIHRPKEWLLGADAPEPVAGPSSAMRNPWPVAVPAAVPNLQLTDFHQALLSRIRNSSTTHIDWVNWRAQIHATDRWESPEPGVFLITSQTGEVSRSVVRIGARYEQLQDPRNSYYRVLPRGQQDPLTDITFITRDESRVSAPFMDIERWTRLAVEEQPIPVSRTPAGEWQMHARLFEHSLDIDMSLAFPSMTGNSRRFAVLRLIEMADPSTTTNANHLLKVRATLDKWLAPSPVKRGQTDDLLRMLRVNDRRNAYVYVGYEGKAPGFTRVDFNLRDPLEPRLQFDATPVRLPRLAAERAAVRTVLEQQGFRVDDLSVLRAGRRAGEFSDESVVTHPRSNQVYYVAYQWLDSGRMTLRNKLTDKWIGVAIKAHPDSELLREVARAMQEQRLGRIVAGIQWASAGNLEPTVYFIKVSPSR